MELCREVGHHGNGTSDPYRAAIAVENGATWASAASTHVVPALKVWANGWIMGHGPIAEGDV